MRQRRHVNGYSNAMATPVEESGWGSGRTVPANITSTLKRTGPGATVVDTAVEPIASSKREKRSGAATARRPQSSGLSGNRDPLAECRPKRRVQSARGAGEKYNRSPGATGEVTTDTVLQSGVDSSLPKIKPPASDVSFASSSVNTTAKNPHRKASPSAISASGTDAVSQVQWAVKATSATVPPQPESVPEPTEMRDLRRLLRERYGEKRSVRQAFLTWDINKDGCLCVDELQNMLKQLGFAQALGQKKVDSILQHVLEMASGSMQYDDFCGFVFSPTDLNQSGSSSSGSRPSFNRQATDHKKLDDEIVPAADADCVVSLLRAKYESRRLHKVFRDWDIDKNGGVTLAEIESNLRRQGLRIAKPQLMKLFDTYDLNHDGRLLYDEFMRLVYGPVHEQRYSYLAAQRRKKQSEQQAEGDPWDFFRRLRLPEQTTHTTDDPGFRATLQRKLQTFASRLNDAYAAFDDDHSGNLSYRELCHGLQQLGLNLTEREFLHLATRVDTDGNGEISFKEFCDIFGGGDAGNRRRRSTPTGVERNERVEEQDVPEVKVQNQDGSLPRRSAGAFNFAHLKRRTKIPTRCGRTPYASTKKLIGSNQENNTSAEFTTESKIYGNGSSCRSASATKVVTTLGQEEKQRHLAANEKRLQRLYAQMENYEAQAQPLQDSYSIAQERRSQTLQRHQERYHQRIEEQRPRCALPPARKGIQRSHPRSTSPFA